MNENVFPPLPKRIKIPFQLPEYKDIIPSFYNYHSLLFEWLQDAFKDYYIKILDRGTSALYLALTDASNTRNRDEVIIPSFACESVLNSVIQAECKPVFVDIDKEDLNIDYEDLLKKITPNTLAIIMVHQYGKLDKNRIKIAELCEEKGIKLIDDCATAGNYFPYHPFKLADYTIFSFNMGKGIFGLGGGVLLSKRLILDKCKRPSLSYLLSRIWKIGIKIRYKKQLTPIFNFLQKIGIVHREEDMSKDKIVPSEIIPRRLGNLQCKITYEILLGYRQYYERMQEIAKEYHRLLSDISQIRLPDMEENMFTKFTILCKDRYELSKYLAEKGIETQWTFYPLHMKQGCPVNASLPNTEEMWKKTLSLPIYSNLKREDIDYICGVIRDFYEKRV
jgi:dTDP-4-amino-4,6-dideoxygalactose transaminase